MAAHDELPAPSYAELYPRPITVEVCQVCRLLWSDHESRARRHYYSELAAGRHDAQRLAPTLRDCVELLKLDRRGPAGPPGPAGEPGAAA